MQNTNKKLSINQARNISEHQQEWINLLCDCGNRLEYDQIADRSKSAMFAIMKYRRLLRGRGLSNVPFITINTAYTQKDYIKLHTLLQELFLEYISNNQFEFILDKLNHTEDGMLKLYGHHINDKNVRILSIALTL